MAPARSRTASIRSSPRARSPRPSTWWWSCCPTPASPPRSSRSRGRSSAKPGWRRRSTRARCRRARKPYDWDATTGLARRFIPGQPGGMHTLTGLAHDRASHVAYDAESNEQGLRARSLKLAALQKTLKAPPVFGDAKGDLLVIGWGSTKGAIEEAVDDAARRGPQGVVACTCAFLQPLRAGHQGDHAALQAGDDDREQLERPTRRTRSSTRTTGATRRSRCCCARATWSTSTAGARCAASRSSPAPSARVIREKLKQK